MEWFSRLFKGRLNRRNFLIGSLIVALPVYLTEIIKVSPYIDIFFSLILITLGLSLQVRRAHDIGWGKRIIVLIISLSLLVIILSFVLLIATVSKNIVLLGISGILNILSGLVLAIIGIFLLLKPGQLGPNKYGDPPSPQLHFPNELLGIN